VRRIEIAGDRRGVGLELTDAGAEAQRLAEQALVERLRHFLSFVDAADHQAALDGLTAMRHALDAAWQAKQ
jgi:DNA-binding MarR family transcriptional regulator